MKTVNMCEKSSGNTTTPIKIPKDFTTNNVKLKESLDLLLSTTLIVEQQKLLKNIAKHAESTEDRHVIANLLSYVFLTIDPKHPLKKTVTRILLSMNEVVVTSEMALQIISLITDCKDSEKFAKLSKENEVLVNLNSCFNNFSVGVEALSSIINLVFIFACNNFLKSVAYLCLENESFDKHTLHVYIYNASKFLVALLNQCDISPHMTELSLKLFVASYKVITDESISFNTKANCGILLIMAAVHTPEKDNDECSRGLATLLKLETEEGGGKLLENALLMSKNYSAKICIFSGILNTVPAEVICADKLDDVSAPIYIFQSLLDSASKRTGKPLEIMEISRTFISLSKLLFNMDISDIDLIFKAGLDYIWTHLDHFIDTVRHDTIIVLKNFVKIAVKHEKDGKSKLMDQIILYISSCLENNNTNYKALTIISNETTCDYLLKKFPEMPRKLLVNLKNNSIAQHVSSTYEALMEQYFKENQEKWIDVWVSQLVPLIHDCENSTYVYYQKIFTTAFKLDQMVIKLLSYGCIYDNPNELGILLSCFITARNMNSTITFYNDNMSMNLWNGMLEHDTMHILACHQIPEIRIATLTLVIECQKTTEIFSEWDLNFLKRFLHYNITTQLPNIRQQMIALYKKAFTRFKESYYVIQRNIKNLTNKLRAVGGKNEKVESELKAYEKQDAYYDEFIVDIFEQELIKGLFPEVNYYRRSVALELLLCMKANIEGVKFEVLWKKDYVILLYKALDDSYESNIIMATKLLLELPPFIVFYQNKETLKTEIKNTVSLAASLKPTCTTTAAYTLQVYKNSPLAFQVLREQQNGAEETDVTLMMINYLITEIENGLKIARDNILVASKSAPIYGLIFSIRHLIQKEHSEEKHPEIIPKLIDLCGRISQIATPIVNNSSPEGFMPTDNENVVDETVTSQMVLVYAWRTVKEVSLLLGELSFKNSKGEQIIPHKSLIEIADYFITLFMETKHRGAYEQAYLGFSKFCNKLWNSGTSYSEWPINWLTTILEVLNGKTDDYSKLCSTRRSAGVPFVIQAILTTEAQNRNHRSFHYCMQTLLQIAEDFSGDNEKPAIHSMNILRALYKHNQLGELVTPYVAKGVMIAVMGFSHFVWGVRNSATLMFSALMMRMFGVQRTKDSEDISIKNRLSARVFFMRYPELYDFILEKLKVFTEEKDNMSLYPLLFILARLYPSAEKSEMLQYLKFINPCLSSSIFKMRKLAAQASIAAMPTDGYVSYIKAILRKITSKISGNTLHGSLLQLKLLLKNLPNNHEDFDIVFLAQGSFWIIEKAGTSVSHMTVTLYMEILILIITRFQEKCYGRDEFVQLMSSILRTLNCEKVLSTSKKDFEITKLALYLQLLAKVINLPSVYREKFLKDVILAALQSNNENYQVFALNCIYYLFNNSYYASPFRTPIDEDEISELEYNIIKPISDDMKLLIINSFKANPFCLNFFTDLFYIIKVRSKEFAIKTCHIIPYFTSVIENIRPKNCPFLLDKQMVLDLFIREMLETDGDMFSVLMPIVSSLVAEEEHQMDYTKLVQDVLKPYSTPENGVEERLAVCNFLVQNPKFLYSDVDLPMEYIIEVWYIVIILLQDNDIDVRNSIARITNFIEYPDPSLATRHTLGMYVISEKTLEVLLQDMPKLIPLEEAMKIYLTLALKPKYIKKEEKETTAEIFDKGELNTYEEGDPIVIVALKCLKKCLWDLEDDLSYTDGSIFIEEHTLLVATRLFNLFYGCHISYARSEDKLLSMLVLKEVMKYLETCTIGASDFKKNFTNLLEKKFMSIFLQNLYMFKYCCVGTFLKCVFSFENN